MIENWLYTLTKNTSKSGLIELSCVRERVEVIPLACYNEGMIQDYIFMIGGFIFILALIPTLRSSDKPPIKTSLMTGGVLATMSICYYTLALYLAWITTAITAVMWMAIAIQKHRQDNQQEQTKRNFEEAYRTSQGRMMVLSDER
jgi:hypothetical protein